MPPLLRCLCLPLLVGVGFLALGCGGSGLTASSSCADFMGASLEDQMEAISKLSSEFETPETATPLGAPNVSYVCAQEPEETLAEYFERAHEAEG